MNHLFRVLLVEDSRNPSEQVMREIHAESEPTDILRVETADELQHAVTEFCPDVIIADLNLRQLPGMTALSLAAKQAPATPFIMLADSAAEESVVACMKAGAADFVVKARLNRLRTAISNALGKRQNRSNEIQTVALRANSSGIDLNLLEASPALIWRSTPEGRLDYCNSNWLDFTGSTREEEYGKGWLRNVHPDDLADVIKLLAELTYSMEPFEIEFRLKRHDGCYRWLKNFGRPLHDGQGVFAWHILYCFDVTDRHETEEILRKLSMAVEKSKTGIVITDTEGCIEYANNSYCTMSGFGLEEMIGRNSRDNLESDTFPDIFGESWDTVKNGGEWRGEIRNRRKNGEIFWEATSISPIDNADEVITHYLVEKEDITLRKQTERDLEESRAELFRKHGELQLLFDQVARSKNEWENTMDCIGDIVILIDEHGRIKRCNSALREFTALSYNQILNTPIKSLLNLHGLALPDDVSSGTEIHHKKSGRWFSCRSYQFCNEKETCSSGYVLTIHDTTEQRRVSDELEKAYQELKATQATIVHQEKMASIGQLAAGVAHEINNPMGFISSNLGTLGKYQAKLSEHIRILSETIEAGSDENARRVLEQNRKTLKIQYVLEDSADLVKESLEGADRVRTIVQNLKSFSRVDQTECKAADINECLESTIKIVWNELKYKADLVRDLGEIPLIRCFPQQINQVFMNLLVNASHAIETHGEIRVRTWHADGWVYASIADNGCGIPETIRNRIFEPFFTTKEVGKGTGLGLSITYDVIKKHHGDIWVESEPGKGTTFTFKLPINQEDLNNIK